MSSFSLKLLAITLMTIDHIGFVLFPTNLTLRMIGRLAFPIFAFQLGIGFEHTKSKERYIFRMLIFTIVSQIPFLMQLYTAYPGASFSLNIGATLTCGLLALYCIEKFNKHWQKFIFSSLVVLIGFFIPMDYGWYGILTVIILYFFRKNKMLSSLGYFVILSTYCYYKNSVFNFPAIWALLPMFLYNEKKGPNIKYLFYIFYPLHMLILVLIKKYIMI